MSRSFEVDVNPNIIKWARENAGWSIEEIASKLKLHFDSKTSILAISEKQNAVKMGINEKRNIRFVKNVVSRVI